MRKTTSAVRTYRFDKMATMINDRIDDPAESGVERYVGLEHLDADSLKIRRWGEITDVESTKLRFKSGDIVFGKRRVYQRKLAVADFEGICSAHAMVLRARPDVVLPEFLPFFMQSDLFMERALAISVGSLSPTINWTDLAAQEFVLPPIEVQQRLVTALLACQRTIDALKEANEAAAHTAKAYQAQVFEGLGAEQQDLKSIVESNGLVRGPFGGSLKKEIFRPSGYAVYEQSHAIYSEFGSVRYFIDQKKFAEMARFHLRPGDLIMSCSGTIGKISIVPDHAAPGIINQALLKIRPDPRKVRPRFLAAYLHSPSFSKAVARLSMGSAMANVASVRLLEKLPCPVPDLGRQDQMIAALEQQRRVHEQLADRATQVQAVKRRLLMLGMECQ